MIPLGVAMHQGKLVFAQVMSHLPLSTFRRCIARYDGEHKVKSFSCLDQFYAMAFAQLTFRESLRDIEACLATQGRRQYHLGFRSPVARNTLANANAVRPWQIYADLAQHLIGIARPLYSNEPIGLDLHRAHLHMTVITGASHLPAFFIRMAPSTQSQMVHRRKLPSWASQIQASK